MIDFLWESIYWLRDFSHPIGFSFIFVASFLLFLSGYRLASVLFAIPSAAVVITTLMAWATHDPTPIEEHFPDGSYRMSFAQSWWEQVQYPVYIWSTLIISVAFVILSVRLYRSSLRLSEAHNNQLQPNADASVE